ncbi:hypothetical protein CHL78_014580 [Romboutsia weinsteinii]|uniref:Uncharacterized protein n=1 Tax=Romboutsia weinsteinii TaxID=2020949 RepID=A0A371J0F6_9FIRM|nr:hypothetical protein [Romboutsia weinsteinii]RDY26174.1 hypothetical protein CHL78_014580 [Romboutsia weinsteinii]
MEINALPLKLTQEDAVDIAKKGRGSFLSKLLLMKKDAHEVRLHYIEFKLVTIEIRYNKSGFRKSNKHDKTHIIKILINGSTGSGSVVNDVPKVIKVKNINRDIVQYSDKDESRVRGKANKMAMRITHRFMGGVPDIKIINIESFFRPYWVVFFGEVKANNRVSYMPVEADGFVINRGF